MYKKLFSKLYREESDQYLEYFWVFIIVFFLVLFLSQALFIWILGPLTSGFMWTLLILWSLLATYFLLFGNSQLLYAKIHEKISSLVKKEKSVSKDQIRLRDVPEVRQLASKPKEEQRFDIPDDVFEKKLEQEAHEEGALISREGIKYIMSFKDAAEKVLHDVIERGKTIYPRFDGWLVLNKGQVETLLAHNIETRVPQPILVEEEQKEEDTIRRERSVLEELSTPPTGDEMAEEEPGRGVYTTKSAKAPINLPTGTFNSNESKAVGTFVELLCDGDEQALFTFVREMRQGREKGTQKFVKEAILILDRIHEHRIDGVGYVDQYVLEKCRCFSNEEIEELIAILVRSIDYRYTLPEIGIKLALVRALEYVKKHRKD